MTLAIDHLHCRLWRAMTGGDGSLRNPSAAIERAFFAVSRHRYVRLFQTYENPRWRTPAEDLAGVFVDDPLFLVTDVEGAAHSTTSKPRYILSLVEQLDVRPGHRVLEIGSGCGWLCAIMAQLAGPSGRVYGVELLPDLAAMSRESLAANGVANVHIHQGDGRLCFEPGAPYDRVIATAGMFTIPEALLDQTAPGARLMLPIALGESTAADVNLYQRTGDPGLIRLSTAPGFFVPLR